MHDVPAKPNSSHSGKASVDHCTTSYLGFSGVVTYGSSRGVVDHCRMLDDLGFTNYCVSLKDSHPERVIELAVKGMLPSHVFRSPIFSWLRCK